MKEDRRWATQIEMTVVETLHRYWPSLTLSIVKLKSNKILYLFKRENKKEYEGRTGQSHHGKSR
jgi:hypothetical protein